MSKWIWIIPLAIVLFVIIYFAILGAVSRKGSAPGLVDGKLSACSSKPNCVCSISSGSNKQSAIQPLPDISVDTVIELIQQMGGEITVQKSGYIAAEFRSGVFGFIDDLELSVSEPGGAIHVRSASRVGHSDFGVNRARVDALRELMEGAR